MAGPWSAGRRGSRCTRSVRTRPAARSVRARPAARTTGAESMHHRGVMVVVTVVAALVSQRHSREEDDRHDEHDARDDGNPCRGDKDPGGPVQRRLCGRRRCSCGGTPHTRGFRCFTHETNDAGVNNGYGYALVKYQL